MRTKVYQQKLCKFGTGFLERDRLKKLLRGLHSQLQGMCDFVVVFVFFQLVWLPHVSSSKRVLEKASDFQWIFFCFFPTGNFPKRGKDIRNSKVLKFVPLFYYINFHIKLKNINTCIWLVLVNNNISWSCTLTELNICRMHNAHKIK